MTDDIELLRRYVEDASEVSFTELVERHVDFVYAAALRQLRGAHRAEDITQAVFTDLARKAHKLTRRRELVGWLYVSTHYAATALIRSEVRREAREQEAFLNQDASADSTAIADWQSIRPFLDEVLHDLNEADRTAVLLRYFKGRSFADIGAALSLTEDAARKRVIRALERLRSLLARRGVTSTAAALALTLASQAGVAAPSGLATIVTNTALASASAATGAASAMNFLGLRGAARTSTVMGGLKTIIGSGV